MYNRACLFVILSFLSLSLYSNGVVFEKSTVGSYLTLKRSAVEVIIENQVAITKTTQTFLNSLGDTLSIKYGFPVPENASVTELKYHINGKWHTAVFASTPQDTATGGPGDHVDELLVGFLGKNPLYFDFEQKIGFDSTLIIELTYVELLEYKFGKVNYNYPNDYLEIQNSYIDEQSLSIQLNSDRQIASIALLSHTADSSSLSGNNAFIAFKQYEVIADSDYFLQYSLNQDELGLYSLSTYIADSLSKDDYGRGFFALIVEPDPSEQTETIDKVFTLIIDRSGSMSGNKIVQAKDAARFIVEHINENDKFNVVSFSSDITSFRSTHVEYNQSSKSAAIDYINSLDANGSTNISGAFDVAIPQFSVADGSTANIVIFLTDGQQTAGITDTDLLISHINDQVLNSEKEVSIFAFGIGSSTNERLLTTVAMNNGGLAEFLEDSELEEVITEFYLMIQNPVLLNTSVEFDPDIIIESYPTELQNLYKGKQLMLFGRYSEAAQLSITFRGNAYANDVVYTYDLALSDSANHNYQFLTKLWAKVKIDELMSQYYLNLNISEIADELKEEIIQLSLDYGVISPFTSFKEDDYGAYVGVDEWDVVDNGQDGSGLLSNDYITITSVGPVPARDFVLVDIETTSMADGPLAIVLVNTYGQIIHMSSEFIQGNTSYTFEIDIRGLGIPPGLYLLVIEHQGKLISRKLIIE